MFEDIEPQTDWLNQQAEHFCQQCQRELKGYDDAERILDDRGCNSNCSI